MEAKRHMGTDQGHVVRVHRQCRLFFPSTTMSDSGRGTFCFPRPLIRQHLAFSRDPVSYRSGLPSDNSRHSYKMQSRFTMHPLPKIVTSSVLEIASCSSGLSLLAISSTHPLGLTGWK